MKILNRPYILPITMVLFFLLFQIPYLTKITKVWCDEVWYSNPAFNFVIGKGFINTNVGSGGGDDFVFYSLILATFFKLFGTSLWVGRFVSVIGGAVGLIGLIQILRFSKINNRIIILTSLLYIFSNVNYIVFRTIRPEAWVIPFAIWGFYFLIKGLSNRENLNFFLSGILISLSFLCHPNGAIYILIFSPVILFFSIRNKTYKAIYAYGLGCFLMAILMVLCIIFVKDDNIILFFSKMLVRTSLDKPSFWGATWENLQTFALNYSLGFKRVIILLCEITILLYGLFFYKKNKIIFLTSVLGLSFFLLSIFFLIPFSTRAFGEVLIFSCVNFGLIINHTKTHLRKSYLIVLIVGLIYLTNNIVGDLYVIVRDHNKTSYSYVEKRIDAVVPDAAIVLTHLTFWFPLKNNDVYNEFTRWNTKPYKKLDDLMKSGNVQYLVISDYLTKSGTATSGRMENKDRYDSNKHYFDKVHAFAVQKGMLIDKIITDNYGIIEIWRINVS